MNTNREAQPYNTTNDTADQSVPELLKEPVDTSEAADPAPEATPTESPCWK